MGGVHAEVEVIYATAPLLRPDRQLSGSGRRNFRHERTSERPAATNAEREGIEIMDASDEGDTPTACSNRQQKKRGGKRKGRRGLRCSDRARTALSAWRPSHEENSVADEKLIAIFGAVESEREAQICRSLLLSLARCFKIKIIQRVMTRRIRGD